MLMVVLMVGMRVARAGALPGAHLGAQDVSGLNGAQLHDVVRTLAAARGEHTVTVVREAVPEAGATEESRLSATGAELGFALDVDATVQRVLRRGRQLNPFAAFADQVRAFFGATTVQPVQQLDNEVFTAWLRDAARKLRVDAVEGAVAFEGTTVARVEPKAGAEVDRAALRRTVRRALFTSDSEPVRALTEPLEPLTDQADLDALERDAKRAVSAPVRLHRDGVTLTLTPEDLAQVLDSERVTDNDDVSLRLTVSPIRLTAQIPAEVMASLERDPVDATFALSGATISVVDSIEGFSFDADAAATQIVELALKLTDREAELVGQTTPPKLTTEAAKGMGITEQVSSFTTAFPCCQGRVKNIARIAEMVNNTVIQRGETFSLNGAVGERTVEKGFTTGGAIYDGEFVEQIGGGVSQFTTTMFNAAFFGGYAIPQHKPHSYYISRYPVGREATLNWPNVDLKILNNSPHGIWVKASTTATSVTVSFYGTKWVEVAESTGPRTNVKPPPVKYEENPALPPGTEKEISSGREGFDITVTRTLTYKSGGSEKERFFTRYLPEPRVIQRNSATPAPEPSGSPTPTDPSASPAPTAAPSQ